MQLSEWPTIFKEYDGANNFSIKHSSDFNVLRIKFELRQARAKLI